MEVDDDQQNSVLCRFNELPINNHATVLIVGIKGIGVDNLVDTMLQTDTSYSMQIRTTTSLPLPKLIGTTDTRPRIDYIIFIVALSNQQSFKMVEEAVQRVSIDYFLGRCCFILSKAKQEHIHSVDINDVTNLVQTCDSPMFCGNLDNNEEQLNIVEKVFHHMEIACGFCSDVNPLLVGATRH